MHLLVLLLLAIPLASAEIAASPMLSAEATLIVALGGQVAIVVAAAALARAVRRGLARGDGWARVRLGDRWQGRLLRATILPHAVACVGGAFLDRTRLAIGDIVVVDELVVVLPPLLAVAAIWWLWAPLEAMARDSDTLMRADRGLAIARRPSRVGLVTAHLRAQVLLVLVPALVALGLVEAARRLFTDVGPAWVSDAAQMGAVVLVLAASPWLVRAVLDAVPLAAGDLRRKLEAVAKAHGVRVGQILVWRTGLTIHNGAVVGVLPGMRCVLLTDALLEDLSEAELLAVMAHEVAHLRYRHVLVAAAVLLGTTAFVGVILDRAARSALSAINVGGNGADRWHPALELVVLAVAVACVLGLFGWVSRRLERQADGFAARHLSSSMTATGSADAYSTEAIETVCGALDAVARPSGIDPARHSWRHGSIRWRQAYLRSLVGRRLGALPVDRQVRLIALAAVALLALATGLEIGARQGW